MEYPSCQHIEQYLVPGKRCHLVGIGGVSMRPLGLVLRRMGMEISGSDMNASVSTDELISKGIQVSIGHRAENIEGVDCLIRTAAAHNDNPEIAAARAKGIPIFERAQAWGYIMQAYKNAICVSGTHGKTTTTSMLTHIFMQADRDPTIMIGGFLPLLGAGHRVGKGNTIILESCEYCNSFLNFFPTVAVILDVDADHLDFFKDLLDVEQSFRKFASLVPADGLIVANGDDKNTRDTLAGMPYLSFGFDEKNDVYGKNFSEDFSEFDVFCGGQPYAHLRLGVIGPPQRTERTGRLRGGVEIQHSWRNHGCGTCEFPWRRPQTRIQGQLPRRGYLRRLRPPSQRTSCAFAGCPPDALPARDLRVPAAYLFAHEGVVSGLCR